MSAHRLLTAAVPLALAAPLAAQQSLLDEDFNYSGSFPPPGWTETHLNSAPGVWDEASLMPIQQYGLLTVLLQDAAGHTYSPLGVLADSHLYSPGISLAGTTSPELVFDREVTWVSYMAHYPNAYSSGTSTIELSSDGGSTWTTVWSEHVLNDGYYTDEIVGLAPYAGLPSVMLDFHYKGVFGHEWVIDDLRVYDAAGPTMTLSGACPGAATVDCANMSPGGLVAIGYAFGTGTWTVPGGGCAGAPVGTASQPTVLFMLVADANGDVTASGNMPASACGVVTLVAFDLTSCRATNTVDL